MYDQYLVTDISCLYRNEDFLFEFKACENNNRRPDIPRIIFFEHNAEIGQVSEPARL